jgi:hypothetical protein
VVITVQAALKSMRTYLCGSKPVKPIRTTMKQTEHSIDADIRSKVPAVTFAFWLIKICATTLGETGGDALSMTLNLGYTISTVIFLPSSSGLRRLRSGREPIVRFFTGA